MDHKAVKNKLRVEHYPQVPCTPFIVEVDNEKEANLVVQALANQHLFLYNNNIIPDYANVITVSMLESEEEAKENDNGGIPEWTSYWNEEEGMEWKELEETYYMQD